MQRKIKLVTIAAILISSTSFVAAADLTKAYEMPDASKLIEKDKLAKPTKYTMPKGCVSTDAASIARGEFIFHNLNGKKAKGTPPKGLVKFVEKKGGGVHHIAFAQPDVAKALTEAEENGVQLIDKQPRKGAEGLSIGFLHPKSTLGVLMEFCGKEEKG